MNDAILRTRLSLAARLDRYEARGRRLAEKLGAPQAWLHEFHEYRADARMTQEEFWVEYTLRRREAQGRLMAVKDQADAEAFYRESDYMLWRNIVHRRHAAWRRVLVTMGDDPDRFLEFGCATAPVSAYVAPRRPRWSYALVDLESPHRDYGVWRVKRCAMVAQVEERAECLGGTFSVITALDVMEHLADPLPIAQRLVRRLAPGGVLHWNFVGNPRRNDLDLATEAQQEETVRYLYDALETVWEEDGYRVGRKR